jgi:hypothetical protein
VLDPCCRRTFLARGVGAWLGLSLASLRLARAQETGAARSGGRADAVIVLWMSGGMSQTDTWDPKPGTPNAGPLGAIRTAAKDVQISELLPRTAEHMGALSLVRSMATREGAHDRARYLVHTGYAPTGTVRHPDLGALVARSLVRPELELPAYVSIGGQGGPGSGFLGVEHAPFVIGDPTRPVADIAYPTGVDDDRFARRRSILEAVERQFHKDHPGDETRGHTEVLARADRLMHASSLKAFDLTDEPAAVRTAYGRASGFGQGCLLARRLVEAGVPAVEVVLDGWDTHQDNFTRNRALAAQLDQGLAALVADLRARDRLSRTLILVASEFGRTPKINANMGRDHHATGWTVALAGGPIRGGRVVGRTSDDGQTVAERPVVAADLMATVAQALGLDPNQQNVTPEGRPIRLVDAAGKPLAELFA